MRQLDGSPVEYFPRAAEWPGMRPPTRVFLIVLGALSLGLPLGSALADDDGWSGPPILVARSVTAVGDHSATLRAYISTGGDSGDVGGDTTYHFDFGATSAYGSVSPNATLYRGNWTAASAQVTGLISGTTYHYRAVATNGHGTTSLKDATFTTTGKPPAPGATSTPAVSGPTPEPALGQTVVAEVASGTVLVKEQGSEDFHALSAAESIPVNSTLDTSQGAVALATAVGHGDSQSATFGGGVFQVRQPKSGNGMTELALRGGDFGACRAGTRARAGATTVRRLWGKDHGGRFKSSGRGSVATVRGTSWYTADRCDGTLTRVSSGQVMVRERGTGRHKLLAAGQSFLAHLPR